MQGSTPSRSARASRYHLKLAALADPLVKINLRELAKTNPRPPTMDEPTYWAGLREKAKTGPIFSANTIQFINDWPKDLLPRDAKPYLMWYANRLKDSGLDADWSSVSTWWMQSVRDYLDAHEWREFESWGELAKLAEAWHEELAEKRNEKITISGDPIVYHFKDGHTIVKVSPENLQAEGEAMGHCVGGYCDAVYRGRTNIYSLRSPEGKPLTTVEISNANTIEQIKGPKNRAPFKPHRPYILEWLRQFELEEDPKLNNDYLALLPANELISMLKQKSITTDAIANILLHLAETGSDNLKSNAEFVEILTEMSKHRDTTIRKAVAKTPYTPTEILDILAYDREPHVVLWVAANPSCSADTLNELSRSAYPFVRRDVVKNPSTSLDTLKYLTIDSAEDIARAARKALRERQDATQPERQARAIRYLRKLAGSNAEPLIKINLRELAKTNPKPPEMSEKDYWGDLRDRAEDAGPVFDRSIIKFIHELPAETIPRNAKQFVIWFGKQLKVIPRNYYAWKRELPLVKDYLDVNELDESKNFKTLYNDALEWHLNMEADDSITIKGDKVVYAFEDGFKIVEVSLKNLKDEGCAMGHCVGKGGYHDAVKKGTTKIYSLRDPEGRPKATVEMETSDGEENIAQIKGPENSIPDDMIKPYLKEWIGSIGKDDSVNIDYLALLSVEELMDKLKALPKVSQYAENKQSILTAFLTHSDITKPMFVELFEGNLIEPWQIVYKYVYGPIRRLSIRFDAFEIIQRYWPSESFVIFDLLNPDTKYVPSFLNKVVNGICKVISNDFSYFAPNVLRTAPLTQKHQTQIIQALTAARSFEAHYIDAFKALFSNPHFHTPFLDEIAEISEDYAKLVRSIKSE